MVSLAVRFICDPAKSGLPQFRNNRRAGRRRYFRVVARDYRVIATFAHETYPETDLGDHYPHIADRDWKKEKEQLTRNYSDDVGRVSQACPACLLFLQRVFPIDQHRRRASRS